MATRLYKPFFLVLALIVVMFIFIMSPTIARSESCTFNWQLSDSQNLDHFNVYIGTSTRNYGQPISVGKATSHTFTGLQAGQTYFLAVKAVDVSGKEIVFSGETTCTVKIAALGDSILQNMEKSRESHETRTKEIEKNLQSETLSTQDTMRLQHELMQLNLQTEMTTKAGDKSSQGVQTLFKNQ